MISIQSHRFDQSRCVFCEIGHLLRQLSDVVGEMATPGVVDGWRARSERHDGEGEVAFVCRCSIVIVAVKEGAARCEEGMIEARERTSFKCSLVVVVVVKCQY